MACTLVGQQFGQLTILEDLRGDRGVRLCRCSCGHQLHVGIGKLRRGQRSCRACAHPPGRPLGSRDGRATVADLVLKAMLDAGPGTVWQLSVRAGVKIRATRWALGQMVARREARPLGDCFIDSGHRARVFGAVIRAAR